jgi:hypothetical protein
MMKRKEPSKRYRIRGNITTSKYNWQLIEFTLKRIVLSHLDNFDIGINMNNAVTTADDIQASS